MFKWIELTRTGEKNKIWVRIDSIYQIVQTVDEEGEPDGSLITVRNGNAYFVKELPDEIMVTIHISENGKDYMISNNDIKNIFFDRYPVAKNTEEKEVKDGEW